MKVGVQNPCNYDEIVKSSYYCVAVIFLNLLVVSITAPNGQLYRSTKECNLILCDHLTSSHFNQFKQKLSLEYFLDGFQLDFKDVLVRMIDKVSLFWGGLLKSTRVKLELFIQGHEPNRCGVYGVDNQLI